MACCFWQGGSSTNIILFNTHFLHALQPGHGNNIALDCLLEFDSSFEACLLAAEEIAMKLFTIVRLHSVQPSIIPHSK